ncbi:efflux RND transporter permease subunit [Defluviitalea raffinosedens]|uniref:efflux RND transporter permease subunit n=1 Tax=Defluviitalea raffinosedens TaxID=1450156 RepID=UPI00195D8A79|nr:MMPL family transporter [Defluviitalea raffinosedens]MBM7686241.1 putative RND superfamily exporter protein [Defluviitalea raffinosedens]
MSKAQDTNFMTKVATVIVDRRKLFFFIFAVLIVFSAFSRNWVNVENKLSAYLAEDSETNMGLKIMEDEFLTYGSAKVMVANISYEQAEMLAGRIEGIEGVSGVDFDESTDHYKDASALFNVTFAYDEKDDRCLEALEILKEELSGYDLYIDTELGNPTAKIITSEVSIITIYAAIIVVSALILTSRTYAEIPVLIMTFLAAAIINMGTNFFFGTISFVSDSVTIVLQLAMSIDYALIFCHRYLEEHEQLPAREAVITALSKAIPEISASSLTTIGGLLAMTFMQYKIGLDMGVVLIKAILLSLLSVFTLMPGLLMVFSNLIDKTKHKNFVPKISFVGEFAYRTRKIIPPIFLLVLVVAMYWSGKVSYVYGYSFLKTPRLNELQIADSMIEDTFGSENLIAMLVPSGDYEAEAKLLKELESYDETDRTMGLANIEAMDGYMLTDKLTPREFSELIDLDYEMAKVLYGLYAVNDENYAKVVSGLDSYSVPLIDMFMFLYEQVDEGYITVEDDVREDLEEAYAQMNDAKQQLQGENFSRMLIYLNLPQEGKDTFAFLDTMHQIADKYYDGDIYLVGEPTSQYDLSKAFVHDNTLVSILSVVFVIVVLLMTFTSVGMPILLIMVIQGSIWINFSFPFLSKTNVFFMSYLIASSIQMGTNIDYAIVISSRYQDLKSKMHPRDAIIETMNLAFPTLITSGMILAVAGILIGNMTSEPAIVGIGQSIGRGTIISLILVMFVLPQILLLGDKVIEKTSFSINTPVRAQNARGVVYVNGRINGKVSGTITGIVRGIIRGDVSALVESGEMKLVGEESEEQEVEIYEKL